jgi:hypothetical protein
MYTCDTHGRVVGMKCARCVCDLLRHAGALCMRCVSILLKKPLFLTYMYMCMHDVGKMWVSKNILKNHSLAKLS